MGVYADYLNTLQDIDSINLERKKLLKKISELRDKRDVLVIASDLSKGRAPISIDYTDILPVHDQLQNLHGSAIDIILETPGGFAEVVEDIVKMIREKYEHVGIIIPGYAKSAGTIFAMAGDEILMGSTSGLGPIDAQITLANGKRYSADAFLKGIEDIKRVVDKTRKLNAAYIPILQNISPGEIQHCENAQCFSKKLVTDWLANYKFKFWTKHSDGRDVTESERNSRAEEIANKLTSQTTWLTHGRSIRIKDLEDLQLKIFDYSKQAELDNAITSYYTLLRMTFEGSNLYKLFETPDSQIYRHVVSNTPVPNAVPLQGAIGDSVSFDLSCKFCSSSFKMQANFKKDIPVPEGVILLTKDSNTIKCPICDKEHNISELKIQIESQTKKEIV
ncbi:MAG: SDH family Clp fold serine proteinase [Candidatus Nitrosopumilus sp. bin_68KS]